jgi:hypothetical protein
MLEKCRHVVGNHQRQDDYKLADEQCIELSLTESGCITYNVCNGKLNQEWSWNAATGTVASVAQPDKCLTFTTANVTGWDGRTLIFFCRLVAPPR